MKAIILAGGLGTRLRDIVQDVPKPMAPVGGKPFLEYLILQLARWDIREIILSTGYKGDIIKSYFGNGKQWGVQIEYSEENRPLGTGGAVRKAAEMIEGNEFIVMNGDSFFDIDLAKLIEFHMHRSSTATMALARVEDTSRYGRVDVTERGEVLGFMEKGRSGTGLINGGLYIFKKNIVDMIPKGNISIESSMLPGLTGKQLYAIVFERFFIDIGIPEDYFRLCKDCRRLFNAVAVV